MGPPLKLLEINCVGKFFCIKKIMNNFLMDKWIFRIEILPVISE